MGRLISEIRYRLRALFRRGAVESELDDEMRFHLEQEVRKRMAAGASRPEAERMARAHFGAVEGTRDDARDSRGVSFLDHLSRDLRFAVRSLAHRKGLTIGVALTLGLGIGVNATMFGIVDRLLFRAPPMLDDPGTVSRVYRFTVDDGQQRIDRNFAFPTFLDISRQTPAFEKVAAFQTRQLGVGDGQEVVEVPVTVASASYFTLFRAVPVRGRFFSEAEDAVPEGSPVVVLGYAFWQTRFGGREVVGQTLRVDRIICTIIGIAPQGFVGMSDQGVPALYLPITAYANAFRGPRYAGNYNWSWLELVVRRRAGVNPEAAEAAVSNGLIESWRKAEAQDKGWGSPEDSRVRGALGPIQLGRGPDAGTETKTATWIGGVALIVLLIACANVANLLLSRAVGRRGEVAMRAALGGSRSRIAGQVMIESVLLSLLGGVAGLALAQWGASGLRAWFLPGDLEVGVLGDSRTLLFVVGAVLVAGVLTGLAPALDAARTITAGSLRADGRQERRERGGLRAVLLVLQPAFSMVLLVGAFLFVRSLRNVREYRLGYDVDPVALVGASLRGAQLDEAMRRELNQRMLDAAATRAGSAVRQPRRIDSVLEQRGTASLRAGRGFGTATRAIHSASWDTRLFPHHGNPHPSRASLRRHRPGGITPGRGRE